jgi:tellurite resistance protein TehA-like permease
MVDVLSYVMIAIVTFCFGLLVSFQIAHIHYVRRLTKLAKRSIDTGTIAPVLVELEKFRKK